MTYPWSREWTDETDDTIRRMRSAGARWKDIADTLGVTRTTVRERARKLGFAQLPKHTREPDPETRSSAPLPPGAPETWGAILAGTSLDGAAWPG